MDNACKWAEGEVTVTVALGKPGRLLVVVSDSGPGLNDDQKQRVIERGERLDQSKPGSGLGLGIVKEIASLYGGKLELNRAPAGGLSVALDLPAADGRRDARARLRVGIPLFLFLLVALFKSLPVSAPATSRSLSFFLSFSGP